MNFRITAYQITNWETWHYLAKYIPLAPFWLWYCLKARSMWFFTPSNPTLTFGGFEGESKKEMYEQLPANSFPGTIYISPETPFSQVEIIVKENGFNYPFAVKPDVGMMGLMFRKINNADQFLKYHMVIPGEYVVQQYISYPLEVSVFYYRFPGKQSGTISGFLRKDHLQVIGDGSSTLWQLILNYDRVSLRLDEMRSKHQNNLNNIIPCGEVFILSPALNLSRGGKLVSLKHEIDDRLLSVFDELSHYTETFFYGRWDIKCSSIDELKQGRNFSILEFNGCGAEPHHIYGNKNSLVQAYRIVLHHWSMLYKISKFNRNNGVSYWKYKKGLNYLTNARKYFKKLKQIDANTELD